MLRHFHSFSFARIFHPKLNAFLPEIISNRERSSRHLSSQSKSFHTTSVHKDIMEFFDDEKNWNVQEVKTGRPWKKEELRIKCNSDLHKLWYVLLKERNMLLTMQHECKKEAELFPSPERIEKVEESMSNLESVVRERNRAYYELEIGWDGEQPCEKVENALGLEENYYLREHVEPRETHSDLPQFNHWDPQHVVDFKKRLTEQKQYRDFKNIRRQHYEIRNLLQRFPHLSNEVLQEKYPDVDVQKFRQNNLEV